MNKIIINFGCGNDIQKDAINYKKEDINLNNKIPIPDESVDEIRCYHVIEHLNDPEYTINEFTRILKKGGLLKIKLPINNSMYQHKRNKHGYGYFYSLYKKEKIYKLISLKAQIRKNGHPIKDTLQRLLTWYQNIFCNEYSWILKKR